MELILPKIGLLFWMVLSFGIVFFLLKKFAFKIILQSLKEREESIENALRAADLAKEEMANLQSKNEDLLKRAKEEKDSMLKDARIISEKLINDAKERATKEANRIVESARINIENERLAAITDIKNEVATLSIDIAKKLLKRELDDESSQKKYADDIIKESNLN